MTRVRNGKTFSREGGQEPRLAEEVGGCEERGSSAGQAPRQEEKGPPEHGWKISFVELWGWGGDSQQGVKESHCRTGSKVLQWVSRAWNVQSRHCDRKHVIGSVWWVLERGF